MYKKFLTNKSIFANKQTALLLGLFFIIRYLSFLLTGHILLQGALVFVILMVFGLLFYKNPSWAWYVLIGELFLGGTGNMFEFLGLSIRTVLILTFMSLWCVRAVNLKKFNNLKLPHNLFYILIFLAIGVLFAGVNGLQNGHSVINIMQDIIPYSFLLLTLPMYHLFEKSEEREYFVRLIVVFLIGSAIFSLITFILFSNGTELIQGPYYKWFRDTLAGKITFMGNGFFRVVTPEHLLVLPATLLISSLIMKNEKHHKLWYGLLTACLLILTLNLSRTYLLSLAVGFIFLKFTHSFLKWLLVIFGTATLTVAMFIGVNFLSSHGQSLGFELISNRFSSLSRPALEASTHTRSALLNPIFSLISAKPFFGSGLGSTIEFLNPVTNDLIRTNQFDWGYLEMWVELGAIGTVLFFSLILIIISLLVQKIISLTDYQDFYVGVLAGVISLLVSNITAPALFHTLGIFFLTMALVITIKPITVMDKTLILLYRVFHKV